jgi:hypothetical protein
MSTKAKFMSDIPDVMQILILKSYSPSLMNAYTTMSGRSRQILPRLGREGTCAPEEPWVFARRHDVFRVFDSPLAAG